MTVSLLYPHEDFREWIDAIKGRFDISAVIGETVSLRGRNGKYMGLCPFHDDHHPSLSVDDTRQTYRCWACGAHGDVVSFVQQSEGVNVIEACRRLGDGYSPNRVVRSTIRDTNHEGIKRARGCWNSASPISNTPAADYLESRSIHLAVACEQENLRFARLSFDGSAKLHPALVAAARNLEGEITGVQRVFLTEAGNKIDKDCKRSLGSTGGSTIRLRGLNAPTGDPAMIYLCEGVEDALSLICYEPTATVWATMGSSNLASAKLPSYCRKVTIAHDNDLAGINAMEQAREAFVKQGLDVFCYPPPERFKDWNEFLVYWDEAEPDHHNPLPWNNFSDDDWYDCEGNWIGLDMPRELERVDF